MSRILTRGAAALLTAAAVAGGTLLTAAPAAAAPKPAGTTKPAFTFCTVTAAERAADLDRLTAQQNRVRAQQPTTAEQAAYRSAIGALVITMLDRKMPPAERNAKLARLGLLHLLLLVAPAPEQKIAIRAEIDAVSLQLDALRLTPAEWRELGTQVVALTRALYRVPTDAELLDIAGELLGLAPRLGCAVSG